MPGEESTHSKVPAFLQGGGEMGKLTRTYNWAETTLGKFAHWSQSLKTTLGILLNSKFPMFLFWGPELTCFYNDAYRPSLGNDGKHPSILGIAGKEAWPEIWETIKPLIDQVLEGGEASWSEDQLIPIYRNGRIEDVYWTFSYSPVTDESGSRTGVLVTCIETTTKVSSHQELKQSYQAQQRLNNELLTANEHLSVVKLGLEKSVGHLAESEERFRTMAEGSGILIAVGDETSNAIYFNKAWTDLTGRSMEELLKFGWVDLVHPDDRERYVNIYLSAFKDRVPFTGEFRVLNQEGNYRWLLANGPPRFRSDGTFAGYISSCVDITLVKEREQEIGSLNDELNRSQALVLEANQDLKSSEEQLRLATRAAELGTFDLDLKAGTMEWDPRCRELFGISHHGKVTYEDDFLPGLHPDDRERVSVLIEKLFDWNISNGEYDVEYRTIGVEDQVERWVRAMGKVFFDEAHAPFRFIGAVLDITEKKHDELRKNDFIGMVSHELKTPLTSLSAIIQVLDVKLKHHEDAFISGALGKAAIQVKKMGSIINGFLNISRLESGKILIDKYVFDLEELIEETIQEAELTVSTHRIQFERCIPVTVNADREKIGSVISNLLNNAVKYSPRSRNINIKCDVYNKFARVSIKDEGMGIKLQDQEKLFHRYYRVESNHSRHISGFGIGLYLCAEIIERHQGEIWVESEKGIGSTFYFSLPLNETN